MVFSEACTGGGHCGGPAWASVASPCPVRQAPLPFGDTQSIFQEKEWATSRAQQQLLWDTLQSLKDKAARAFPLPFPQGHDDPFRETYSDGGLYGANCNYGIGFHGIQGRQPKCEDYVLHLALGPDLFTPFDDCNRACLACVLDGHGGTGAVQYVAERFPSYLLADLPRLRSHPAAAMRSALHRIDEELTALGHNSGTTVNALLLVNNRVTVVNTGDCRCILYDWVEERAVQVTHDHNLLSSRERERVLGAGAEISGCGGYVVLPCPMDGAKLLGVTKALGHAGVKALQRSYTMNSLAGIQEQLDQQQEQQQGGAEQQQTQQPPKLQQQRSQPQGSILDLIGNGLGVGGSGGGGRGSFHHHHGGFGGGVGMTESRFKATSAPGLSPSSLYSSNGNGCGGATATTAEDMPPVVGAGASAAVAVKSVSADVSGSGMSEDLSPAGPAAYEHGGEDVEMRDELSSTRLQPPQVVAASVHDETASCAATAAAASTAGVMVGAPSGLCKGLSGFSRCSSNGACNKERSSGSSSMNNKSSFSAPAGAAAAAVAAGAAITAAASAAIAAPAAVGAPGGSLPEVAAEALVGGAMEELPLRGGSLASVGSQGCFLLTCEPDEFEFTVEDDRHMVLLGCDGVFDRMNNTEACKTALRQLTNNNSCADAAREVAHRACRLGSCDNITALVLRFGRKPIMRRQSFSVLSLRRCSSNASGDLATSGGSSTQIQSPGASPVPAPVLGGAGVLRHM